jgi:carbon-monoxide dehydrogenase medium subunit
MGDVRYFAPTDLGEAVKLLAQYGKQATILAGGTDLVPKINYYELKPEVLLYVGNLGLSYIKQVDGTLVIGAGTSLAQILASELVAQSAPALVHAAKQHSSVAVRSAATLGGNIANGSPAADTVVPLIAMDAKLRLVSAKGERVVAIQDFFVGPGETVLKADELLTEIQIPAVKGKAVFQKLGKRKAQACSIVIVGVRLEMDGKVCKAARIALGSMAPTPLRCVKAEEMLVGKAVDAALVAQCAAAAVGASSPIDDVRATAWYRQKAGTALVAQALALAAGLES